MGSLRNSPRTAAVSVSAATRWNQEVGLGTERGASALAQAKRLEQQGELIRLNDIIMNGKRRDIIY